MLICVSCSANASMKSQPWHTIGFFLVIILSRLFRHLCIYLPLSFEIINLFSCCDNNCKSLTAVSVFFRRTTFGPSGGPCFIIVLSALLHGSLQRPHKKKKKERHSTNVPPNDSQLDYSLYHLWAKKKGGHHYSEPMWNPLAAWCSTKRIPSWHIGRNGTH